MFVTPMDLQDKSQPTVKKEREKAMDDFHYSYKFRYAFISMILFFVLSQNVSYQILNLIVQTISNNIEVMNTDNNSPSILGILIMTAILGVIVFLV